MSHIKEDRRVKRTRQLLQDALISLILEKGYEAITIQNIIDRANVGRSTFYAHFQDKDDLLLNGVYELGDDLHEHIVEEIAGGKQAGDLNTLSCRPLFDHAAANHRLYKAMVGGKGIDVVWDAGESYLRIYLQEQLKLLLNGNKDPLVPMPVTLTYLTGALFSLLRWWLENDMPYPPEQIDEMFQQLAMPGVRAGLGLKG